MGAPVPAVYPARNGNLCSVLNGHLCVVTEWIDGSPPEPYKANIIQAGSGGNLVGLCHNLLFSISGILTPSPLSFQENTLDGRIEDVTSRLKNHSAGALAKKKIAKLLASHRDHIRVANHFRSDLPELAEFGMTIGDLSLSQILFDGFGKAIALIDWEYAGTMNFLADDVASCLFRSFLRSEGTPINLQAMAAYVESYQLARRTSADFWQVVAVRLYEGSQQHVLGLLDNWLSGPPYDVTKKTRQFLARRLLLSYRAMEWLLNNFTQVENAIFEAYKAAF